MLPLLDDKGNKYVQEVMGGTFLYYARAGDATMVLPALSTWDNGNTTSKYNQKHNGKS